MSRAILPFPTTSRNPADFLHCTVSLWIEEDAEGNASKPKILCGMPQTEHVIVEFDADAGTDACIFLQAQYADDGVSIHYLFDDGVWVPFVPMHDASALESKAMATQTKLITEDALPLNAISSEWPSQINVARQRIAVGVAHGVMVRSVMPGSNLRQPGERKARAKTGESDNGTGIGWASPVAVQWRTHRTSTLYCDMQIIAEDDKELAIFREAGDSFTPLSDANHVLTSAEKFRPPSVYHLALALGLRKESGHGNLGYTSRARGNLTGRNGGDKRELGPILVVQGRAAKFTDAYGNMGIVVVLSARPSSPGQEDDLLEMVLSGVVWPDCISNRGGTRISSPPQALTECAVGTFDGGFSISADDLFKTCRGYTTEQATGQGFSDMRSMRMKCNYLQAHGTPFDSNASLRPYLSPNESFLVAAVWRASNAGLRSLPIDSLKDCAYLPGNFVLSFAQTVVTTHIQAFANAITVSQAFL